MITFLLFTVITQAAVLEVVGPCSPVPEVLQTREIVAGTSVGAMTVTALEANHIPFHGSAEGIYSILGTPEGDGAIEVISDKKMRAYGWCYEVDGKQPDVMPDKILLQGSEHVKWFYAFSLYKDGDWRSYCEPAYKVRRKDLCR